MSETSVIIDGIRSPLLEFGPANSDEAVVFVHGNPGSIGATAAAAVLGFARFLKRRAPSDTPPREVKT